MDFLLLSSFGEVMSYIGYILIAILILLVMITVHEAGHYIAGKIFHFGIEEFAIGFGPKIFSKTKKNGEKFSVRALPLGGFCAFHGEDEESDRADAFNKQKPLKRIIVLIAGAFMNYLLALFIIIIMFAIYGQTAFVAYKTTAGVFNDRDIILKADGVNIYLTTDLMGAIGGKKQGEEVTFRIIRDGAETDITVPLAADADFKSVEDMKTLYDALGIYYETAEDGGIVNGGLYQTSVRLGFFSCLGKSFEYSFKVAGTVFTVIGQLLTGRLGLNAVGGTITTISVTAQSISRGGFRYLLYISSFIGVNLAVFNLLPIPALDGSHVVFTVIEWIRGKPINKKAERIIHAVGLVLLISFAIFVDLQRCF